MLNRSLGKNGRGFRMRNVVELGMACVVLAMVSGCVAEAKHREVTRELNIATKVNRDLENRMKVAEVELAEARGSQGIGEVGLRALQAELDAVRLENAHLHEQNGLLEDRVRNIPALDLPQGGGFREEEFAGFDGVTVERGELILEGDVTFASGKTDLRGEAKLVLDRVAQVVNGRHKGKKIYISGHTDNTPLNKSKRLYKDNWDLAARRAHAVFQYLETKGIADTSMVLEAHGFASPAAGVDPNSNSGRARCRRVEIHLGAN